MKMVYICSPLRGDYEKNIAKANEYAREEAMKGNCAIAPHCVFTQFLNDEVPDERWLGQEMGKALLCRCDELLVCGSIISEGMREEIKTAYENGIAVLGRDLSIADIGDGQHGSASFATPKEIDAAFQRVRYEPQVWRRKGYAFFEKDWTTFSSSSSFRNAKVMYCDPLSE